MGKWWIFQIAKEKYDVENPNNLMIFQIILQKYDVENYLENYLENDGSY